MKSWNTKNGFKIIEVLSGGSNSYLILKENIIVLVDTGRKSAFDTLKGNIESLNIDISDISFLILTHTHYDHCQSAKKIKDKSNCKVVVSSEAKDSTVDGYTTIPKGSWLITKIIARLGQLIGKRKYGYEPFQADILVNGDYEINSTVAKGIKIIETRGHSTDSISILVDDEIAVVGDTLFGVFKNSILPPFADDIHKMVKSWKVLLDTGCLTFLPGHGNEINSTLLQKEYDKYAQKFNNQSSI